MARLLFSILLPALQAQECRITPITPLQPPARIEEGERATESQTFQGVFGQVAVGPDNTVYFADAVNRVRRVVNGRVVTVAGNGARAEDLAEWPAIETAMPPVGFVLISPAGVPHFTAVGRLWRVVGGRIQAVAGSGRPGFNGEDGPATTINLGSIVHAEFASDGSLLLIDGFNRVRRVGADGQLRTVAGSSRLGAVTGDGGPAVNATLSNPRQVYQLGDGAFWIRDLAGRQLRMVDRAGTIRTVNANFDTAVSLMRLNDGRPAAITANRVYPVQANGSIQTGGAPYSPFTGAPLATGPDGALYFLGSERPEMRNPLVRLAPAAGQTLVAGAPVVANVDGQAPPFGFWLRRTNSLIYSAAVDGKTGIVESRPGQSARFLVGGGGDIGDPDGKDATSIAFFGVASFTADGAGRIVVADTSRQRLLVVDASGKVAVLKDASGSPVLFAPLGAFGSLMRIAADNDGNIYWYAQGATPTGGVFSAELAVWRRSDSSLRRIPVQGLAALFTLDDGGAAVIAGNSATFRSVFRVLPDRLGSVVEPYRMLPLTSVAMDGATPYFTAASRLFRGGPGSIEMLDVQFMANGAAFNPAFVMNSPDGPLVRLGDSGFYRIGGSCRWIPQPRVDAVVNAAGFDHPGITSPRQLLSVFGPGFGPGSGQGFLPDGTLRAMPQQPPYPALLLGSFTGAIPNATLTGTPLSVIHANAQQTTLQGVAATPASGEYLLYFAWQGLTLMYPRPILARAAAPSLFQANGAAAGVNEDGSIHSASNPAAPGTVLQLYGTGLGATDYVSAAGEFYSLTVPARHTGAVTALIDGQPAVVDFAGGAPGAVIGVSQINVVLPRALAPGPHTIQVQVDGVPAPGESVAVIYSK
ncbi:MAG: hypothetical protein FJW40_05330 [Acidobacteria bacterium]|nr:hypothetical protein [Acidobacteriota bacterium]